MTRTFTALIHKEDNWYVADCPEVGTVSQGKTIEEQLPISKKQPNFTWRNFPRQKPAIHC